MFDLLIVGFWIRSGHLDQVTPNLAFPSKGKCPLLELITTSTNKRVLFFHFKGAIPIIRVSPDMEVFPDSAVFCLFHSEAQAHKNAFENCEKIRCIAHIGE